MESLREYYEAKFVLLGSVVGAWLVNLCVAAVAGVVGECDSVNTYVLVFLIVAAAYACCGAPDHVKAQRNAEVDLAEKIDEVCKTAGAASQGVQATVTQSAVVREAADTDSTKLGKLLPATNVVRLISCQPGSRYARTQHCHELHHAHRDSHTPKR